MNELTKELIAVGASVTTNCQPCLEYHVQEAQKFGASESMIKDAIEVGQMVKKGAMRKFNELIPTILDTAKAPE